MTMRCEYELLGGHVHCRVFGPGSGRAGELIFRENEWDWFVEMHRHWVFTNRAANVGS